MSGKAARLKKMAREIARCRACRRGKIGKHVAGEGSENARVVFIGEAPGKQEAKVGRPFIGRSGKLLRQEIRRIGLKEREVFITSPVKYLPKRGTPSKADISHGRIHLLKQLKIINPKLIVLLGRVAVQGVLERQLPVVKVHGTVLKKDGKTYFITFHPAAALRFPKIKRLFHGDFQKLKRLLPRAH